MRRAEGSGTTTQAPRGCAGPAAGSSARAPAPPALPRALRPRPGAEHRAAARDRVAALGDQRSRLPALEQRPELHGDLLAHEHVEAIAGLDERRAARGDRLIAADDDVEQRFAGQAELAHAAAD